MDRSKLANGIFAGLLGGIVGFLALFLREIGMISGAIVLAAMCLYHFRNQRANDAGWLLFGAGLVPALFLGRNAVTSIVDPAVQVGPDTWMLLTVFVAVALVGAFVASRRWSTARA